MDAARWARRGPHRRFVGGPMRCRYGVDRTPGFCLNSLREGSVQPEAGDRGAGDERRAQQRGPHGKATPSLSADIFGDWREEVIWPTLDGRELRIYTSTIPTDRRFYTFMHDPQYRLAIAWQNVAYNQPPHPSFYLDESAPLPKRPEIRFAGD